MKHTIQQASLPAAAVAQTSLPAATIESDSGSSASGDSSDQVADDSASGSGLDEEGNKPMQAKSKNEDANKPIKVKSKNFYEKDKNKIAENVKKSTPATVDKSKKQNNGKSNKKESSSGKYPGFDCLAIFRLLSYSVAMQMGCQFKEHFIETSNLPFEFIRQISSLYYFSPRNSLELLYYDCPFSEIIAIVGLIFQFFWRKLRQLVPFFM